MNLVIFIVSAAGLFCSGAFVGAIKGFRAGWKSQKFIDVKTTRKPGNYRTPDQYAVEVADRKYLVNCIGEIPQPDRKIVRDNTISHLNWNLHFLRDDPDALLRECTKCKKKWYPHQEHDFASCKKGETLDDYHGPMAQMREKAIEAHAERASKEHFEAKEGAPRRGNLWLVPGTGMNRPK